jgi:enamine deaminase RidA (YjgF/YER057c/UK114 family)
VEISAVAVTDLKQARLVRPRGYAMQSAVAPAVRAGERVYVSGVLGRRADTNRIPDDADGQVKLALEHLRMLVEPAGRRLADLNIATVYITDALDTAAVEKRLSEHLPGGYTLVRTASLPFGANVEITAIAAPDLVVRSGRGTVDEILRGFGGLDRAVVSNVYIDAIDNFGAMNKVYAGYAGEIRPTRTTVQPVRASAPAMNQISIATVR